MRRSEVTSNLNEEWQFTSLLYHKVSVLMQVSLTTKMSDYCMKRETSAKKWCIKKYQEPDIMMIKFTRQIMWSNKKIMSSKTSKTGNNRNRPQSNSMRISSFLQIQRPNAMPASWNIIKLKKYQKFNSSAWYGKISTLYSE